MDQPHIRGIDQVFLFEIPQWWIIGPELRKVTFTEAHDLARQFAAMYQHRIKVRLLRRHSTGKRIK